MNERVFQNSILDKQLKENLADAALSLLINNKFIEMKKNSLKNIKVEFAYLFLDFDGNPSALLKIITPKKLFKPEKVYYFGTQDGKLLLLNEKFTEETFLETKRGMFARHNVNAALEDPNSYKMELH